MKIEQNPDGMLLLKIWWSVMWRWVMWYGVGILALFLVSTIIGFVARVSGADPDSMQGVMFIFSLIGGVFISIWAFIKAFRKILGKEIGHVRVVLMAQNAEAMDDPMAEDSAYPAKASLQD